MQREGDVTDRDTIDLAAIVMALRSGWKIVLAIAIAAVLIEAVRLHGAPAIYRVEMQVAAVTTIGNRGEPMSPVQTPEASMQQFFASGTQFVFYLESLHARGVADELAKDPAVLKALFYDQWDEARGAWQQKPSSVRRAETALRSLLGWPAPAWQPPGGAQVHQFLIRNIATEQDTRKHVFATISMQSSEPDFAMRFLIQLNQIANDRLRANALMQSRQIIADLNALPDARIDNAAARIRDEQQRVEARAVSTAPFAAQLLDGPAARPDPVNAPFKSLIAALFLGAAAGIVLVFSLRWLGAFIAIVSQTRVRRETADRSGRQAVL